MGTDSSMLSCNPGSQLHCRVRVHGVTMEAAAAQPTALSPDARRSNQSIWKEISPGISLEGMMLKLKLQYFGHLM